MIGFDSVGYHVYFHKVDPPQVGMPVTRSRVHYVGFLKNLSSTNPDVLIGEKINSLWSELSISVRNDQSWDLDDFIYGGHDDPSLDEMQSVRYLSSCENQEAQALPEPAAKKRKIANAMEPAWPQMHKRICEEHQVQSFVKSVIGLDCSQQARS